jgi:outer membrane protein assembly factor BamB
LARVVRLRNILRHNAKTMRRHLPAVIAALSLFAACSAAHADVWPRFRGPNGDGQASATSVPSEITAADFTWKSALPGVGHSSPVVWNDRVFVTSADGETAELYVMCFDLATGQEQWQRRLPGGAHPKHLTNSFATATPAVDADGIYVAWKAGDTVKLVAISHAGDELWQADVGTQTEVHGFGASPMLAGDVICITNDTDVEANSEFIGLDRRTGQRLWHTPCGVGKTSYATPCLWQTSAGRTLVLQPTMSRGLTAYDPTTGAVVWNALPDALPDRCVSSPVIMGDIVMLMCGAGNVGKQLVAAKLQPGDAPAVEAYRMTQTIPQIPTPVQAGGLAFIWSDRGIVTCFDVATGKVHYRERIGGAAGSNFHCSPLRVDDRIFNISLSGEIIVLAASEDYQLIARSELGEPVTATPAVVDGRMLIRTEQSLICLGGKAAAGAAGEVAAGSSP